MYEKNFARGGACTKWVTKCTPADAVRPSVCLDGKLVPGAYFAAVEWIAADMATEGLICHESDALHMFVGGNPKDHENLNAQIDFQIENDHLVFSETSFVFVPKGCAYNIVSAKDVKKPLLHYVVLISDSEYQAKQAEAKAPQGTYANYRVTKYERPDGITPEAPEGFLTFLLWIDNAKLAGAPYTECVWFHTVNPTGPAEHIHDDMEVIAFIGSDPEHPEELNGDVSFYMGGETIHTKKSTLVFVPGKVSHSPILVHELEKDILHFSGENTGDYVRDSNGVISHG